MGIYLGRILENVFYIAGFALFTVAYIGVFIGIVLLVLYALVRVVSYAWKVGQQCSR